MNCQLLSMKNYFLVQQYTSLVMQALQSFALVSRIALPLRKDKIFITNQVE